MIIFIIGTILAAIGILLIVGSQIKEINNLKVKINEINGIKQIYRMRLDQINNIASQHKHYIHDEEGEVCDIEYDGRDYEVIKHLSNLIGFKED